MPCELDDFQMEEERTMELCLVCVMCPCICILTRLESRLCVLSINEEVLLSTVHNPEHSDRLTEGKVDCPLTERLPTPTPSPVTPSHANILIYPKQGLQQDSEAVTIKTWRVTFYLSYLPFLKTAT